MPDYDEVNKDNFLISDGLYNWFGMDRLGNQSTIGMDKYPVTYTAGCTSCYHGAVCNFPLFASFDADGDMVDYLKGGAIPIPSKYGTSKYAKHPIDWHPAPCCFNISLSGTTPLTNFCNTYDDINFSAYSRSKGYSGELWLGYFFEFGHSYLLSSIQKRSYNNTTIVYCYLTYKVASGQNVINDPPALNLVVVLLTDGKTAYFKKTIANSFYYFNNDDSIPSDYLSDRLIYDGREFSSSINYSNLITTEIVDGYQENLSELQDVYNISDISINIEPVTNTESNLVGNYFCTDTVFPRGWIVSNDRGSSLQFFGMLENRYSKCNTEHIVIKGTHIAFGASLGNADYDQVNVKINIGGIQEDGEDVEGINGTFALYDNSFTTQSSYRPPHYYYDSIANTETGRCFSILSTEPDNSVLSYSLYNSPYSANIVRPIMDCDCPENKLCISEVVVYLGLYIGDYETYSGDRNLIYEIERDNVSLIMWVEFLRDVSDYSGSLGSNQRVALFKKTIATSFIKLQNDLCISGNTETVYVVNDTMPEDLTFSDFEFVEQVSSDDLSIQTWDFSGANITVSAELIDSVDLTNYNVYQSWNDYESISLNLPEFTWTDKTYTVTQCLRSWGGSCSEWSALQNYTETELNGLVIGGNYELVNTACIPSRGEVFDTSHYIYLHPEDPDFKYMPDDICLGTSNSSLIICNKGDYYPALSILSGRPIGAGSIFSGQNPLNSISFNLYHTTLPNSDDDTIYYYLMCTVRGLYPEWGYALRPQSSADTFFKFIKILSAPYCPLGTHTLNFYNRSFCYFVDGNPVPLPGWSTNGSVTVTIPEILEPYPIPVCD